MGHSWRTISQDIDCNVKDGSLYFATQVGQPFWVMFQSHSSMQLVKQKDGLLDFLRLASPSIHQ